MTHASCCPLCIRLARALPSVPIRTGAALLACAVLAGIPATPALAQAQQAEAPGHPKTLVNLKNDPSELAAPRASDSTDAVMGMSGEEFRARLASQRKQIEEDIADLERILGWVDLLDYIATTDPAKAVTWRLPITTCRSIVLEPRCGQMTEVFAPDANGGEQEGLR